MPAVSSYKFGQFELDLRSYELKRDGEPLRLEKIPMELLIFLVEHHSQLVTREQIIERLWGKHIFLDTEQGVNTAIRKIRQVLLDDPEKPQFLETVVGKGYRFVSNVTVKGNESPPSREDLPPPHGPQMTRNRTRDLWLIGPVSVLLLLGVVLLGSVVSDRMGDKTTNYNFVPLDCGASSRKLVGGSISGVLCRWHHRRAHHSIGQTSRVACHLSYFDHAIQELAEATSRHRSRLERRCRSRGFCVPFWQSRSRHRAIG